MLRRDWYVGEFGEEGGGFDIGEVIPSVFVVDSVLEIAVGLVEFVDVEVFVSQFLQLGNFLIECVVAEARDFREEPAAEQLKFVALDCFSRRTSLCFLVVWAFGYEIEFFSDLVAHDVLVERFNKADGDEVGEDDESSDDAKHFDDVWVLDDVVFEQSFVGEGDVVVAGEGGVGGGGVLELVVFVVEVVVGGEGGLGRVEGVAGGGEGDLLFGEGDVVGHGSCGWVEVASDLLH